MDLDVFAIGSVEIDFQVEDKYFPINDVILMAKQFLSDFIWAIPVKSSTPTALNPDPVRWSPLINPLVKVKF